MAIHIKIFVGRKSTAKTADNIDSRKLKAKVS